MIAQKMHQVGGYRGRGHRLLCHFAGIASVLCVFLLPASRASAESYEVEVGSGRRFAADIDPRTDQETLWLSFGERSAKVARPIQWDRVVRVSDETGTYSRAEFIPVALARAAAVAAEGRDAASRRSTAVVPAALEVFPDLAPAPLSPRVTHVDVDAFVANWDPDVEADGVVVYVTPVDRHGNDASINGTLVVELFGERPTVRPEGEKFPRLGRWTRTLTPDDFGPRGAVVRLKFQAVHPEFDRRVSSYGLLHARLNVPGSGAFETSVSTLRIRPYSAYRDSLETHRGHRFLPVERLGRTK